ncbi:hypothetical protein SAMN04488030_0436 [Aliiroseovarius halocynthiae]|uniref:Lipoprotein n=1 Tax=Aliiroseovarius halocynthiae TaxID=985055 RepID=A0A545STY7_9RHOB|nr:hypothetical protein [Aliiroseovarius halocynthiae]TQV68429.1 hypothetical protein FIL88_02220 [Aliiroseovarius halocynthiae]SMR70823.1 hypothetical protein SAMN04488030_0436 [Aliiroseovarius halocynthiae]
MRIRIFPVATIVALGLAACQTSKTPFVAAQTRIAAAPDGVAPAGVATVPASAASKLFRKICVANRGDFSRVHSTAKSLGFVDSGDGNTLVHRKYDMSFATPQTSTGTVCSVIFAGNTRPEKDVEEFVKGVTDAQNSIVFVSVMPGNGGKFYINAQVASK